MSTTAMYVNTRSSADADKPAHAFRGQSRSPKLAPFDRLGMVSYWCCIVTFSLKRTVFEIFDLGKCRDLEITIKGHFFIFSYFFYFGSCARLSWLNCQLSSAR